MKKITFDTISDVLRFAISEEQNAIRYYTQQAQSTTNYEKRTLWEQLATDEIRHKAILSNVREQELLGDKEINLIIDLDQTEIYHSEEVSDLNEVIYEAIKAEEQACKMYLDLANITDNDHIKGVLITIASEEKAHRDSLINDLNIQK
ncbi:MAG: ferritin family protein [Bacteroidota bacterium]|nr:ferritin family protein [Bacteroidota bacterium]